MSALLWALPALPMVAGALLLAVRRRAAPVAVAVAVATLVIAVVVAEARPRAGTVLFAGLRSGLAVDGLSAVMVVTVAAVSLAVLVYAAGEMREGRFFGLMLIFVGAMLATVTAADLVLLLMAWELMGAMSYALIGFWWQDPVRARSASIAFVTTRAGDLGLYFAAGCALAGARSLEIAALPGATRPWLDLVAAGLVAAALGKSAQLPFSFWLSRAMAGPSPVSALLHSATMVAAGAYLLLRIQPLLAATGWAATLVAWVGAATALLLGAVAVAQRDLKQLLAASTCAQIGFMVLAAGVAAVPGGTAHLVAHAAVKSLLFLGAGAWLAALDTKDLTDLHGAARRYRLVGVTFGVGALALAGLPPLSLWVTKDAVLAEVHSPPLYAVILAASVLAAAYAAKAIIAVWRPVDSGTGDDTEQPGTRHIGLLERIPLPVLALAAATLGAVGLPTVFTAWTRLLGTPAATGPGPGELVVSGALALVAVVATATWSRRRAADPVPRQPAEQGAGLGRPDRGLRPEGPGVQPGPSGRDVWRGRPDVEPGPSGRGFWQGWLGLEAAAVAVVWRPMMAVARALAWLDDAVVDGAVRAVPRLGMAGARLARRPLEMGIDGAVQSVAGVAARLGALARRPQTGQVHTYLAQAAVVFVLLAVVVALVR